MASKGARSLNEAMKGLSLTSQICRDATSHRIPSLTRSMATEAGVPKPGVTEYYRPPTTVPVTIFGFPSYEPRRLEAWSTKHLSLPLRRDILHLAVVHEGDNTRQGTASSKTRYEIRGSNRKLYAQKGTGRARVGDKKSPLRRGGGKSFGPKPRDFGTNLNRKVYDLAWRTALSYRYRRGELIVCEDGMELPMPDVYEQLLQQETFTDELALAFQARWAREVLERNDWGKQAGRSTFITTDYRPNLFDAIDEIPRYGRALDTEDLDVKDLLESSRIIIERSALQELIEKHQSDLVSSVYVVNGSLPKGPESGKVLVQ
ncbi:ribosomal protein L4 domain-containing protein [Microdochium trichocladiopsis]|uniref:Large ribosomal subunit protein uL4m n=1 Tax=Microdochium trichocladiopsis TaxID=1682393 RepID=A0A9P9BS38_9PEZI|nr:ribosomal protein L4 domain-containing protein [Microdochium trichocladiopsis]KAH7033358.1 ribosomal protein L4 domain-containing protein [Microdochium trichocladiopsis]